MPTRALADLEANAFKFWPTHLAEREQDTSIIPLLIETQDKFISLLHIADAEPDGFVNVLGHTKKMPGNIFLKHLIVLTDIGGEPLQRIRRELSRLFPHGQFIYRWRDKEYKYAFQSLAEFRSWTNEKLGVDGKGLLKLTDLQPVHVDVAMLLMHGSTTLAPHFPEDIAAKCQIGSMLGNKPLLDSFIRQRYIHVSRITGGATANSMGQLCQAYVREYLKNKLPDWNFNRTTIPGVSQNDGRTDTSFDIVAESPASRCCAIEVSFQVTTNSTIERKAGQAQARQRQLHRAGHKVAYVIDGAGNFERQSALATICRHADCVVSFKDEELDKLVRFLKRTNS